MPLGFNIGGGCHSGAVGRIEFIVCMVGGIWDALSLKSGRQYNHGLGTKLFYCLFYGDFPSLLSTISRWNCSRNHCCLRFDTPLPGKIMHT